MADVIIVEEVQIVITESDDVRVVTVGTQGPPGIAGNETYVHTQLVPAATWVIVHGLGTYPSVTIVDSANSMAIGEVTYDSLLQVTVTFSSAFGGKAFLN